MLETQHIATNPETSSGQRNFISQKVNDFPPSGIRKFFDLTASMKEVISLGIGEPDFVTPWHIREAATYSLEKGYTMYTSNSGLLELRQELARYLELHYGVSYNPESEILITVGTSEGLDLTMRAILNPGEEIIIPDPHYVAYPADIILAGGVPIFVPVSEENNFAIKASDIEPRITKQTKAILIGYPANPTGAVIFKSELNNIARLAEKYDLLVISDEIYARLIYSVEHTCFSSLLGMKERTILIGGFSKSYAMTGWRIGYVAASRQFIQPMTKIHQYTMLCCPTMAQMAAIEALKHGESEVEKMMQDYDIRRRIMLKGLNDVGLPCFEAKGAFYAFPSVRKTGLSSVDFASQLLKKKKVAVVPGTAFGPEGEGYIRISYASGFDQLKEAFVRIEEFVKNR